MAIQRVRTPYSDSHEFLQIEGDAIHYKQERIIRTVKLSDFLEKLQSQGDQITPVLPQGCRFYQKKGNDSVLIVEQPPKTRYLTWTGVSAAGIKWKLAFPYIVFALQMRKSSVSEVFTDHCKIFYRNAPISNQSDRLYRVNLGNVWNNHKICTGGPNGMRVTGTSLAQKVESYVSGFWLTSFNTDLLDHFRHAQRKFPELASLEAWQTKTAEDDTFPLRIDWEEVGTITKVIQGISAGE